MKSLALLALMLTGTTTAATAADVRWTCAVHLTGCGTREIGYCKGYPGVPDAKTISFVLDANTETFIGPDGQRDPVTIQEGLRNLFVMQHGEGSTEFHSDLRIVVVDEFFRIHNPDGSLGGYAAQPATYQGRCTREGPS